MRSLSTRMLLAALGTLLLSFIAFLAVFFLQSGPQIDTLFHGYHALQLQDAAAAFRHGGRPEASAFLGRLSRRMGITYYLTDARGQDVLSGADRSNLLGTGRFGRNLSVGNRVVLTETSPDGAFHLIALLPPPFNIRDFLPYYFLIPAAVVLLWWLLAVGIASPIRQLTAAVGRFGRGDLAARAAIARHDEVGNLAIAFNDMAERIQTLMTAQRQLLQDISHELRSPLTRLSIGVELLRTTNDRERAIGRLQVEVERLTTLVGTLIEVTRNEGDPASRRSESFDVGAIVRDVVETCKVEADLRGCRLVLAGGTARTLLGDPELIRRAIDNVIRNAIRYAPSNTDVDVRVTDGPSDTLVSVRDAGPGVPEAVLPRLGDPFFRVDAARGANTGGVGLGLAIARRALLLHNGTLVAENAGPGLRVVLTIPCRQAPAAPAA